MYRGSPPYLPCDASGAVLLAPSQCTQAIGVDKVFEDTHFAAVPPHLRLLSASLPDSFAALHVLPAALTVNISVLSSHCLQDASVRAMTAGHLLNADVPMDPLVEDAHEKVS